MSVKHNFPGSYWPEQAKELLCLALKIYIVIISITMLSFICMNSTDTFILNNLVVQCINLNNSCAPSLLPTLNCG